MTGILKIQEITICLHSGPWQSPYEDHCNPGQRIQIHTTGPDESISGQTTL
ncbi:MAG: hypothetical protein KKE62_07020 [Proteobacteria bacterium]|nr:hypothetical protein [Pseudomonadota bacterium]MBU1542582.1 hypothetical protein [Pseudomonadota bacterium]